jgi:ubiquinone/menaquinone biosynthesis C-methylase UbiE
MTNKFSNTYKEQVLNNWIGRSQLNHQEKYLFKTYMTDNSLPVLEAGTGNGILSFYLEQQYGFNDIIAFDIIPEMVLEAKRKAKVNKSQIRFVEANASEMTCFSDGNFQYLVYLQQVLCMIPQDKLEITLDEAYRIGSADATYLFSFLDWNSRIYNPLLSFIINTLRVFNRRPFQKYYIPEIKGQNRFNWGFYKKRQHSILWVKKRDIMKKLESKGFQVISFYEEETITKQKGTAFYLVCKKISA